MTSTTEHVDYAETPAQKTRHQLEHDLARARGRIENLVTELGEARRASRSRARALVVARKRIESLQRANETLSKSWARTAAEVDELDRKLAAIKRALEETT